ncbi:putative protein phosphatase 2C 38 [Hibiscus syriacus]|uniref:PPM-type phosphatase domain-containing protein n=1 Tax=Hibiscus syriacus TaxID=106335 RepID=A0A6A3B8D5_HIBSY|nr:putative protein phosphatase 2C 38 [Hibiscus syriacus]
MSADVINKAFLATEEEFLALVRKHWLNDPQMASVGDSRVVLGKLDNDFKEVKGVQLSSEHNSSLESVREELRSLHPYDPQIVILKHTVWGVKGIIQISRSIGDAYLKNAEFNREPLLPKFRVPESFDKPILRADPSILVHKIDPEDHFLIFASDGLWEHLSNQEAVHIVNTCPPAYLAPSTSIVPEPYVTAPPAGYPMSKEESQNRLLSKPSPKVMDSGREVKY